MRGPIAFALLFAASGCGPTGAPLPPGPPPLPPLGERIDALLAEPPFSGAQWGILALDPTSGDTLYARSPDRRFIPASNMKLVVSGAALALLGPEFRWETDFFAVGPVEEGVLAGDLYLLASGDPTLGPPFFESGEAALAGLVEVLRAAGIRRVEGGLVLDAAPWDSTTVPASWMIEDLPGTNGATGGIFTLEEGVLRIRLRGGSLPGEPAVLGWSPWEGGRFVENRVRTGEPGSPTRVEAGFLPESGRWVLSGSIAPGDTLALSRSQRDPVRLAFDALALALETGGISVEGEGRILWEAGLPLEGGCASGTLAACGGARWLAGVRSPALMQLLPPILGESHNWMAEQLLRTLGSVGGAGTPGEASFGSVATGTRVVAGFLEQEVGVDPIDIRLRDGSGLSTQNLLTPRAVVALLRHAREAPWGSYFRQGLAEPGAPEETLETRLPGMAGRLHAKTGTLTNVGALSGTLLREDGSELLFSILVNGSNLPSNTLRERIDLVVEALALP